MNPAVSHYFIDGCGRCPLGGTPHCKVNSWPQELRMLRMIVLDCGLVEELKWGMPCYTFRQKNIAIVSAFKEYCAINFFKGSLLADEAGILFKAGESSQAARLIKFTGLKEIVQIESTLKAYIHEAIEVENAGLKVAFKQRPEPIPEEFQKKLDKNDTLNTAFESLTSGRQRAYIIHFSQPKQTRTREARIEKCIPQILMGKGFNEDYKQKR